MILIYLCCHLKNIHIQTLNVSTSFPKLTSWTIMHNYYSYYIVQTLKFGLGHVIFLILQESRLLLK